MVLRRRVLLYALVSYVIRNGVYTVPSALTTAALSRLMASHLTQREGCRCCHQRRDDEVPFDKITPPGFLFARDGNKVYFTPFAKDPTEINDAEMSEKDLVSGKISKITNFNIDKILNYTISRDGTKLYLVRGNSTDEVVLIRSVD